VYSYLPTYLPTVLAGDRGRNSFSCSRSLLTRNFGCMSSIWVGQSVPRELVDLRLEPTNFRPDFFPGPIFRADLNLAQINSYRAAHLELEAAVRLDLNHIQTCNVITRLLF
jgi:hypothetical protein